MWWLLQLFGNFLARIFTSGLGWAIGAIIGALGIGFITYTGVEYLINTLFNQVISDFNALPTTMLQILLILKLDIAICMIFSAFATRAVIKNVWKSFSTISIFK